MAIYQKCIPHAYRASIFDIDFQSLKKQGKLALFFDLDNTIIGYDEDILHDTHVALLHKLAEDFKIVILSNTNQRRVTSALSQTDFPCIWHATKPLKRGFKKALKIAKINKDQAVMIGDQLMTDILGGNRMGLTTILVKSVKRKSDRKLTKINRMFERFILKRIQKKMPEMYQKRLLDYVNDHKV